MAIIPKINEYYFEDGHFHIRSKFFRNVRTGLMIGLVLGGFLANTSSSHFIDKEQNMQYVTKEAKYADYIVERNNQVSKTEAIKIAKSVVRWSNEFGLDDRLLLAVMEVESRFDKHAMSSAGAMGLMQVMVKVHWEKLKDIKKITGTPEPFDIDNNVYLGARILKDCTSQFKEEKKSLQCYNGSVGMQTDFDKKVQSAKKLVIFT